MGLHVTAEDLARVETASRVMLSPLALDSIDDWRREVNRMVRELFRGDKTVFMLPHEDRLFFSEEAPHLAAGVEDFVTAYTADAFYLSDAVVDFWNRLRRTARLDVFTWSGNEQMIGRFGYSMNDSEMVSGVLRTHKVQDFIGCFTASAVGEVMLWLLFDRKDAVRFGDHSAVLWRALLPSFNAGLEVLARMNAQRQALDVLADALIVFGPDRRELHRNSALTCLLEAEAERDHLQAAVAGMAGGLHTLTFSASGGAAAFEPGLRRVRTRRAAYELVGTLLPPGAFGGDPSVLITVRRQGDVQLPDSEALRERYGLTAREAEVALLIAEGHSNEDIAERLYVSPHTARRHTANIFDKLGIRSRKALGLKLLQEPPPS